jgi:hypothetical protein
MRTCKRVAAIVLIALIAAPTIAAVLLAAAAMPFWRLVHRLTGWSWTSMLARPTKAAEPGPPLPPPHVNCRCSTEPLPSADTPTAVAAQKSQVDEDLSGPVTGYTIAAAGGWWAPQTDWTQGRN